MLLPAGPGVFGDNLLGQLRHTAMLRDLGELTHLGEALGELARRASALAGENPAWLAPSQVVVAQRLTESARTLDESSQLILRHREAALRAAGG